MSFPPAAPWHTLAAMQQWYSLLPARLPSLPLFSLALLEVVTSQLLLAGILATNAPMNPVYMAILGKSESADSGRQTKKRRREALLEVFFSLSPPFVARGDSGGSGLDPGGGREGPKVLILCGRGRRRARAAGPHTLQQLLPSAQSPPPPHLAVVTQGLFGWIVVRDFRTQLAMELQAECVVFQFMVGSTLTPCFFSNLSIGYKLRLMEVWILPVLLQQYPLPKLNQLPMFLVWLHVATSFTWQTASSGLCSLQQSC